MDVFLSFFFFNVICKLELGLNVFSVKRADAVTQTYEEFGRLLSHVGNNQHLEEVC